MKPGAFSVGREASRAIRASLPHTWVPFFSRFGRLTEVQTLTIPRILRGENVVVISPAASGKTEAVVAPVVERTLGQRGQGARWSCVGRTKGEAGAAEGLRILYVSPTRALVNDLHRRLAEPMEYLGLGLGRKTGDHPGIDEQGLPFALITTPESFDSLLCRHPRIFAGLGAVVLDELHLLDNSPRGDQLRVLLERLRLVNPNLRSTCSAGSDSGFRTPDAGCDAGASLQYCALSATIDDLDIGTRYFPNPQVVKVTSEREIDVELLRMGNDWHGEVLGALQGHGCRKVLCFFNARSSSEKAAKLLDRPPFQGRVWVHHGSLNKEVREAVEERMNKEKTGLLCCTSTLELGIDIGDIDAVVLVRPPFNVSSLLQRLGRGNRRRQSYLRVLGLHVNEWEKFLFETFLECARNGHLYEKRYTPSLSVIPQQLLSYAFQRRRIGMTRESARRALAPLVSRDESFNLIFRHMVETGKLVAEREGIYQTGVDVERQVASGKIHSNIQDKSFGEYEVVEQTTGRKVGAVFFVFHHFMLGGRSWELVQRDEKRKRLLVRPLAAVTTHTQVFEGTGTGGYSYRLAPILKARLFPELEPDEFPYFREGRETMLLHLLGPTYGFILSEALSGRAMDVSDMDGKLFMLTGNAGRGLGTFPIPEAAAIREVIRGSLARLEDNLGSGAFFRLLPEELQVEDHMLTLDVEGLLAYMRGLSVVELPAEQVTAAIRSRLGSAPAD